MGWHGPLTQKYKLLTLTICKGEYRRFNVENVMGFNFADCQSKLPYKGVLGEFTVAPLLNITLYTLRSHCTKFGALVRRVTVLAKFLHKAPDYN